MAVGTFTTRDQSGYHNLNPDQLEQAKDLEFLPEHNAYRLPLQARLQRITSLLRAFARLDGGAKQTLHHTDVSPVFVAMAVLRGGNNPFMYLLNPGLNVAALDEALMAYAADLLSPVTVGLRNGFIDSAPLEARGLLPQHPRQAFEQIIQWLWDNPAWLK